MWFIGVEVEQETSAPPPKKNPGSAPALCIHLGQNKGVPPFCTNQGCGPEFSPSLAFHQNLKD